MEIKQDLAFSVLTPRLHTHNQQNPVSDENKAAAIITSQQTSTCYSTDSYIMPNGHVGPFLLIYDDKYA